MEHIELMHRHQINKSFHKQLALEIVAGIEHQPAPGKPRLILDGYARYGPSHIPDRFRRKDLRRQ